MFQSPAAAALAEWVDCDTLAVECPTCSGGIYGDQLEDHDQRCPRSSIGMAAC